MSAHHLNNDTLPGLITLETRRRFEEVISCVLLPIVFLVGFVCNALSFTVLIYQSIGEGTNLLLIGLTVTDFLFILFSFGFEMECLIRPFDSVFAIKMEVWTSRYLYVPAFIMGRISSLFICLVALERYIVVQYPFKASRLVTRKVVVLSMLFTYVIGFAFCGCLLFAFDVGEAFRADLNTTVPILIHSQYANDHFEFLMFYSDTVLAVVFSILPVSFVLFCTCSIIRELRKSYDQRIQLTGNRVTGKIDFRQDSEQRKITKMLLTICILFIVCTIPGIINQTAHLIFGKDGFNNVGRYENIAAVVASAAFLFSLINSSVNFILYIATSKKFAASFRHLFMCGLRVRHQNDDITKSKSTDESDIASAG